MATKPITEITDDRGNRATIAHWGDEAKARAALESLRRCSRCSDCSDCSDCFGCFDCFRCFDCSGCSRCSGCFGCSDCSGCSRCSGCFDCFRCFDCSGCSRCSGCFGCSDCSDCFGTKGEARNFAVPIIGNIHRKLFDAVSRPNALNMNNFHTCETTHCRAGWAIHLAGEAGYALERQTSPVFAAMQIYRASGYEISPVRFFGTNEAALEDMRRLAEAAT